MVKDLNKLNTTSINESNNYSKIWLDEQIIQLDDILRINFSKEIDEFAHNILTYLCELTSASRGVFFIKAENITYLKAISGYACAKEILKNTIFEMGEGLVGQAAESKKELFFENITDFICYQEFATLKININSLLFMPLVFNNQVYGVLELAFLHNLDKKYLDFLGMAGKNIAVMMESITNHTATQTFLKITQQQKNLLNEREDELKRNLEQMESMHGILQKQNIKVYEAYLKLEKTNNSILESIRYAKRIQEAILPSNEKLQAAFGDYFLIYQPRDIVSGDFYWYLEAKNRKFFGVIDCTGHGVPGAFMSMIANTLLNQIVMENEIYEPSLILATLHKKVKNAIRHDASKSNDGMDLMICSIETPKNNQFRLSFSGAKCNLYYTSDNTLHKMNGDRISIGEITMQDQLSFNNHEIMLKKGDLLYLTTDGLIDICNPSRKRFGKRRFEDLLNNIKHLPMIQQKKEIEIETKIFQEGVEPRDDITLLAITL
jgi:serine phosphatase RsbU (regulator of sigma subunit)